METQPSALCDLCKCDSVLLPKNSLAWKNKRVVHLMFSVENVYDSMIMEKNATRPKYINI